MFTWSTFRRIYEKMLIYITNVFQKFMLRINSKILINLKSIEVNNEMRSNQVDIKIWKRIQITSNGNKI